MSEGSKVPGSSLAHLSNKLETESSLWVGRQNELQTNRALGVNNIKAIVLLWPPFALMLFTREPTALGTSFFWPPPKYAEKKSLWRFSDKIFLLISIRNAMVVLATYDWKTQKAGKIITYQLYSICTQTSKFKPYIKH